MNTMTHDIEQVVLPPVQALGIRATVPMSALPRFFGEAFHELAAAATSEGRSMAGPPFARYHSVATETIDVEAVMPIRGATGTTGRVHPVDLAGGPAIQVHHVGPYDGIKPAYEAIARWMAEHRRAPAEPPREVYLTDPQAVPDPNRWETLVIQPLRPEGQTPR